MTGEHPGSAFHPARSASWPARRRWSKAKAFSSAATATEAPARGREEPPTPFNPAAKHAIVRLPRVLAPEAASDSPRRRPAYVDGDPTPFAGRTSRSRVLSRVLSVLFVSTGLDLPAFIVHRHADHLADRWRLLILRRVRPRAVRMRFIEISSLDIRDDLPLLPALAADERVGVVMSRPARRTAPLGRWLGRDVRRLSLPPGGPDELELRVEAFNAFNSSTTATPT